MVFRRVLSNYRVISERPSAVSPYIFANCCSVGRSVIPSFRLVLGRPPAGPGHELRLTSYDSNSIYWRLRAGNRRVTYNRWRAVQWANRSKLIRPDLVWYFTYLSNYYITGLWQRYTNGINKRLMDRLQSVLNASARFVHNSRKYDRISPLLRDLHMHGCASLKFWTHQVSSGRSCVPLSQSDCTELPGERPTVGRHGRLAETTAVGDNSEAARASHTTNDRRPRLWRCCTARLERPACWHRFCTATGHFQTALEDSSVWTIIRLTTDLVICPWSFAYGRINTVVNNNNNNNNNIAVSGWRQRTSTAATHRPTYIALQATWQGAPAEGHPQSANYDQRTSLPGYWVNMLQRP